VSALSAPANNPNDMLILVDPEDHDVGFLSKEACHRGQGVLHRAFSVFLFNAAGETLLQQRSAKKPLWPLYWSNSCCSHPRRGESVDEAAPRRVREELGLGCTLRYLYKFQYQAPFGDVGSENELCYVYTGMLTGEPRANPDEIAGLRFVAPAALTREVAGHPERFTPWMKMEWERIRSERI
jgi:isopentenyl-diphosphate delta-isomerase